MPESLLHLRNRVEQDIHRSVSDNLAVREQVAAYLAIGDRAENYEGCKRDLIRKVLTLRCLVRTDEAGEIERKCRNV